MPGGDLSGWMPGYAYLTAMCGMPCCRCQGVPIRAEVGPKDVKKRAVRLVRRDTGDKVRAAWTDGVRIQHTC